MISSMIMQINVKDEGYTKKEDLRGQKEEKETAAVLPKSLHLLRILMRNCSVTKGEDSREIFLTVRCSYRVDKILVEENA